VDQSPAGRDATDSGRGSAPVRHGNVAAPASARLGRTEAAVLPSAQPAFHDHDMRVQKRPPRADWSVPASDLTTAPEMRAYSAFRAPCPSVTSRRGHSACRWPTSRRVTATAPAKSHAHDPVAGARKGTPWPCSR